MSYSLRQIAPDDKFCHDLYLDVFDQIIAPALIAEVLDECGAWEKREQKLNMVSTLAFLIAMDLFPTLSQAHVFQAIAQGLRYVWPEPDIELPGASALAYRRRQLGLDPLIHLFGRVCRPLATKQTPGAFRFGLRLMALDSTVENVPDTLANELAFGRSASQHGQSAFPQVRGLYLLECGTHAIISAIFAPCRPSEQWGAFLLLHALTPEMLLMWDRGFFNARLFKLARDRGAHVLARLPAGALTSCHQRLADGTYLAWLYPDDDHGHQRGTPMLVRVIEYTITDPLLPGYGQTHRLVTTLLDPQTAPALELIETYHERWEIEIAIDEIDTAQRLCQHTLRSLTPEGVLQELYGVLLAYYAVRSLMFQSAQQADLDVDRLSFTHAICVITKAVAEFAMTSIPQRQELHQRLLRDLRSQLLPPRRLRINPRVIKSKRSKFPLKKPDHRHLPQPNKDTPFRDLIALLHPPPPVLVSLPDPPFLQVILCI